jgi:hypothetical protein
VSGVSNKKFQITNTKWFDKPFDRLTVLSEVEGLTTTLSQVEGQITTTEIQNPKHLAFDPPPADMDTVIWDLFGPILKSGGTCNLLFLSEP